MPKPAAHPTQSYHDYYPFGMEMPGRSYEAGDYRFGFNGMEGDRDVLGVPDFYNTLNRLYDARLGRWLSVDPLAAMVVAESPYSGLGNSPLILTDPNGNLRDKWEVNTDNGNVTRVDGTGGTNTQHIIETGSKGGAAYEVAGSSFNVGNQQSADKPYFSISLAGAMYTAESAKPIANAPVVNNPSNTSSGLNQTQSPQSLPESISSTGSAPYPSPAAQVIQPPATGLTSLSGGSLNIPEPNLSQQYLSTWYGGSFVGKMAHGIADDAFITFQCFTTGAYNANHLDGTGAGGTTVDAGLNTLLTVFPMTKISKELNISKSVVNAAQFNKLYTGTGITAAKGGGVYIRQFNYGIRESQSFNTLYPIVTTTLSTIDASANRTR